MRIREILADLLGAVCLFGTFYGLFFLGYGLGF